MRIIDIHTHVFPQYADLAVRTMDAAGISWSVTLAWHDGFGTLLRKQMEVFNRHPGRFVVFGNVDFARVNEPGFGEMAAAQMAEDFRAGMRGIKVYKALGLTYKDRDGALIRVNDPRLDPIWKQAGELGIPVLIHTADPVFFWQPVNDDNFWNGVLHGEYAWWTYYRKAVPSLDELIAERNDVIRRHPRTCFIAPHLGSRAEALDLAADDLDALPNLHMDFSARVPILGCSERRRQHARDFMLAYPDRLLFGTDLIFDDTNVPTGMQAQSLYQPYEVPIPAGMTPETRYIETSVALVQSQLDFLRTNRVQLNPPFKRRKDGYAIQGLKLPPHVCDQILWKNAEKLLPAPGPLAHTC